ncbi:O-methyltransferase [Geosmithia morbida]|uniref:O-methyltransferase n=1 Tax=Geosmithia morbida TaxID=1094350 RepID=A0A9P4Z222_9HYPO|nr:O-methyltransferase [Geosmithia morbida]KAF4126250.1 O-methyltransferase [Geosmithia morbida]
MAQPNLTLNDIAERVSDLTRQFSQVLANDGIQQPTLSPDSPTRYSDLTGETLVLRQHLIDSINDLSVLVQGPSESIVNYCHNVMPDQACLSILNHFHFWFAVPLDHSASYEEISKYTKLPIEVVRRVLEHAVTLRLFSKAGPRGVKHTSRSAALTKESGLRAAVTTLLEEVGPPMTIMNQTLRLHAFDKSELSSGMDVTAFSLLHSGTLFGGKKYTSPWDFIENDGEGESKGWRQRSFADFMSYIKDVFHFEDVVQAVYDWQGAGEIKVVDLGGSGGHDSVALARKFPNLNITVQDLPEARLAFDANTPAELKDRVTFMAHNFFEPQPVQADIYLIKLTLHDWPDAECLKILRALVPSMRKGAKILFVDYVSKQETPDDLPLSIQQMGTSTDLRMLAMFNTEERLVKTWTGLFEAVDDRLAIIRVDANPLGFYAVIEAEWQE